MKPELLCGILKIDFAQILREQIIFGHTSPLVSPLTAQSSGNAAATVTKQEEQKCIRKSSLVF
jgi:hypothetical protein